MCVEIRLFCIICKDGRPKSDSAMCDECFKEIYIDSIIRYNAKLVKEVKRDNSSRLSGLGKRSGKAKRPLTPEEMSEDIRTIIANRVDYYD